MGLKCKEYSFNDDFMCGSGSTIHFLSLAGNYCQINDEIFVMSFILCLHNLSASMLVGYIKPKTVLPKSLTNGLDREPTFLYERFD